MPLIEAEMVTRWLPGGEGNPQQVAAVVAAINESFPVADYPWLYTDSVGMYAKKNAELGGTMLAARLLRRRNSPGGVEAITSDNVAYTARTDPDVAQLLQLGDFQPPHTQIG